jgi:hypothetical protein
MNPALARMYGTEKTAAADEQISLDNISASDFLAALEAGEIDLNDFVEEEPEKTASPQIDLSQFSNEELVAAFEELEQEPAEKVASSEEAQYWDTAGRLMARGYAEELNKTASAETTMDLNALSAEDIVGLAYGLAEEMDKTAATDEDEIDLNELTADELVELAYALSDDEEPEKTAGIDLNQLSVDDFIGFAAELEQEMSKEAGIDLNQLSVDEFIGFAAGIEDEMSKEAGKEKMTEGLISRLRGHYTGREASRAARQKTMQAQMSSKALEKHYAKGGSGSAEAQAKIDESVVGKAKRRAAVREYAPELAAGTAVATGSGLTLSQLAKRRKQKAEARA